MYHVTYVSPPLCSCSPRVNLATTALYFVSLDVHLDLVVSQPASQRIVVSLSTSPTVESDLGATTLQLGQPPIQLFSPCQIPGMNRVGQLKSSAGNQLTLTDIRIQQSQTQGQPHRCHIICKSIQPWFWIFQLTNARRTLVLAPSKSRSRSWIMNWVHSKRKWQRCEKVRVKWVIRHPPIRLTSSLFNLTT